MTKRNKPHPSFRAAKDCFLDNLLRLKPHLFSALVKDAVKHSSTCGDLRDVVGKKTLDGISVQDACESWLTKEVADFVGNEDQTGLNFVRRCVSLPVSPPRGPEAPALATHTSMKSG